jgi:hypothetical protein
MQHFKDAIQQNNPQLFSEALLNYGSEYPPYIHTDWIFHWIYTYEATNIIPVFQLYLQNHPLNHITNKQFSQTMQRYFDQYAFYQALKTNHRVKELCDNKTRIPYLHHILFWRLMKLTPSTETVEALRDYNYKRSAQIYSNAPSYMIADHADIKKMTWEDLLAKSDLLLPSYDEQLADTLKHFTFGEKINFLETFYHKVASFHFRALVRSLAIAGDIDAFTYMQSEWPHFSMSIENYVLSCKSGNLPAALAFLNKLLNTNITMQKLSYLNIQKKIRTKIRKSHIIKALTNSLESKSPELIEFNKALLNCHDIKPGLIESIESEHKQGILSDKITISEKIYTALQDKELFTKDTTIAFLEHNKINIELTEQHFTNDIYRICFYCCHLGYRRAFNYISVDIDDDALVMHKKNYENVLKYYDELNIKMKEHIRETQVLYVPLLNIVSEYALY